MILNNKLDLKYFATFSKHFTSDTISNQSGIQFALYSNINTRLPMNCIFETMGRFKVLMGVITLVLGFTLNVKGQNIKASDFNALDLLGKPYNSVELLTLMSLHSADRNRELLDPTVNSYTVECWKGGYALEFDINFTLKSIRLFRKGHTYEKCEIQAPYHVALGMHIDTVHNNNLLFQLDEYAEMKLFGDFAESKVELYFRDDYVEMIKIEAKASFLAKANGENSKSWRFRLIPDGKCVTGTCKNDSGYMRWADGMVEYKGQWKYGFPHGEGLYRDSFGNMYKGQFKLGFFWGTGTLTRSEEHYVGDMIMGEKTGQGRGTYPNGATYEGSWQKDIITGKGRLEVSKTYFYEGDFVNGIYQGQGKLGSKDGYYEGGFKNGKPHGRGAQYAYDSKKLLKGTWKNGLKHGSFQLSSPNQSTEKMHFENDLEVPVKEN
jgi:hypothetical protein